MAQISCTLLAAVCLQLLLLLAGHIFASSPKDDPAEWEGRQCTKTNSISLQRLRRHINFSERNRGPWTNRLCSTGRRQSPVDITSGRLKKTNIEPLIFDQYDIPFPTSISFDDFIVTLMPFEDHQPRPIVRGGNLKGNYVFAGLHFHFGSEGQQGSEHLLEGRRFDGEMHMVHYNDKYTDLEKAKLHRDGLAVLGTWLEEEKDTLISSNPRHNNAAYQWMKNLAETYLRNDEEELTKILATSKDDSNFFWEPLALKDFLTTEINHFFRPLFRERDLDSVPLPHHRPARVHEDAAPEGDHRQGSSAPQQQDHSLWRGHDDLLHWSGYVHHPLRILDPPSPTRFTQDCPITAYTAYRATAHRAYSIQSNSIQSNSIQSNSIQSTSPVDVCAHKIRFKCLKFQ